MNSKVILVTGSAGFIGNEVSLALLNSGYDVVGLDNLNDYYDVSLKKARLDRISLHPNFTESRINLENKDLVMGLFKKHKPNRVIHLAAQAGVRHSLINPHAYTDSNIVGFLNILEGCRFSKVEHLVFASSSSVYGSNSIMPFAEEDPVDHPISLYAATKRANELMGHTYSHLFNIPCTGLRFFTVYGPWGRPDMALFLFTKAILSGENINVFNNGNMKRSFTFIDDIVKGVVQVLKNVPKLDTNSTGPKSSNVAPYRILNIGNNKPERLLTYIETIENYLGIKAKKIFLPMQAGDVRESWASVENLKQIIEYEPETSIQSGVAKFLDWYKEFYQ